MPANVVAVQLLALSCQHAQVTPSSSLCVMQHGTAFAAPPVGGLSQIAWSSSLHAQISC